MLRRNYGRRRDAMLAALAKYFPKSAAWTQPEGGMFLLVTLPGQHQRGRLCRRHLERRVAFSAGRGISPEWRRQKHNALEFFQRAAGADRSGNKKVGDGSSS